MPKNWLMEDGALQVPFRFLWLDQRQGLVRRFGSDCEKGIPQRRALTARFFTGAYRNAIGDIAVPQELFAVGRKLM